MSKDVDIDIDEVSSLAFSEKEKDWHSRVEMEENKAAPSTPYGHEYFPAFGGNNKEVGPVRQPNRKNNGCWWRRWGRTKDRFRQCKRVCALASPGIYIEEIYLESLRRKTKSKKKVSAAATMSLLYSHLFISELEGDNEQW